MAVSLLSGSHNHAVYKPADLAATAVSAGDAIPAILYLTCTFQFIWSGVSAGTATVQLQSSVDGTNFDDITGATASTSGSSGSASIHLTSLPGAYIRANQTVGASAGTTSFRYALKR